MHLRIKSSIQWIFILAAVLSIGLSGCRASHSVAGDRGHVKVHSTKGTKEKGKDKKEQAGKFDPSGLDDVTGRLLSEAYSWQGTPYLYGGNDREGVDCSGFVLQVYKRALDIALPRVSRQQYEYCKPLKRGDLVPGDLVFYATTSDATRVSHVGIYVGNDRMIHSSTSRGVIESDMNSSYYSSHYFGAGRIERFHAMRSKKQKSDTPKASPTPPAKPEEPDMASVATTPAKRGVTVTPSPPAAPKVETAQAPTTEEPPVESPAPARVHRAARSHTSAATASSTDAVSALRQSVLSSLPDPNAPQN